MTSWYWDAFRIAGSFGGNPPIESTCDDPVMRGFDFFFTLNIDQHLTNSPVVSKIRRLSAK